MLLIQCMTYQDLYNKYIVEICSGYKNKWENRLAIYDNLVDFSSIGNILDKVLYSDRVREGLLDIEAIVITNIQTNLMDMVKRDLVPLFSKYSISLLELDNKMNYEISNINKEKQILIEMKKNEIRYCIEKFDLSIASILGKHKKIIKRKTELENIFSLYNIESNGVKVDLSSCSLEELSNLIDISEFACSITIDDSKFLNRVISLLYLPLSVKLENPETQKVFMISYAISLIFALLLLKPYSMAIIGFVYIVKMLSNMQKVYDKELLLKLAYALSDEFNFNVFLDNDKEYIRLNNELADLESTDLTKDISNIKAKYSRLREILDFDNPQNVLIEAQDLYNRNMMNIDREYLEAKENVERELSRIENLYKSEIAKMLEYYKDMNSKLEPLGTVINRFKTIGENIKIGEISYLDTKVKEIEIELPISNLLIPYHEESELPNLFGTMKILLCNYLCNVREKYLDVTYYDSRGYGSDIPEFIDDQLDVTFRCETNGLEKILEKLYKSAKENNSRQSGDNVKDYNMKSEEIGKVTITYKLLIIASAEEKLLSNEKFKSFLEKSINQGIIIWYLVDMTSEEGIKNQILLDKLISKVPVLKEDCVIMPNGDVKSFLVEYPMVNFKYDFKLGNQVKELLKTTIKLNKVDILDYQKGYRELLVPDEKIWTYDTLNGIELRFGYEDGDPSKYTSYVLGDKLPHMLEVGETGGGKSALTNQTLATLLYMYPPEWLEIILVDFKNIEFPMYTGDLLIPHVKIVAGTTDGEYVLSIYTYLIDIMEKRTDLFQTIKVQNIVDWNKHWIKLNRLDMIMPNILLIEDEFQTQFSKVDDATMEKVKALIADCARLARFAGLRMWFCSQSMVGTLPSDIMDQFKLRVALGCSKDTSSMILGNKDAAEKIREIGWVMVNDTGAKNPKANRMWRVPFINNKQIKDYIPKLMDKCKTEGRINRDAYYYQEKKLHTESDLIEVYENKRDLIGDSNVMVLGERMAFDINTLPINRALMKKDSENILCAAFEQSSILNLTSTFITNIMQKGDKAQLYLNSADEDVVTLLGLNTILPDDDITRYILNNTRDVVDLIELMEDEIEDRQENKDSEYKTMYFLLIYWEKYEDMASRYNERFKVILRDAGKVDIHFIVIVKEVDYFRQLRSMFNHKIGSYLDDNESGKLTDTGKCTKLKPTQAMYFYGSEQKRFKIYQYELKGTIGKREVVDIK